MIALSTYAIFILFGALCFLVIWSRPAAPFGIIALGAHALSVTVILAAAVTNGLVFDASTYLGDLWTAFDAIVKAADGTKSSINYFNPIGPVYEWGFRVALLFRPPSAAVLPLANALIAAMVLAVTIVMLRRRVSPLAIALVGLIAVTTATSPRDLDTLFVAGEASFLAPYNRWGWALFVPVIFLFAAPARNHDVQGPLLAGFLIALMLLLKPTYGLAALGMAEVRAVLLPGRWRDGVTAIIGALVTLIVLEVLTGQVSSYLADLVETMRMEQTGLRPLKLFEQTAEFGLACMFSLLVLSTLTHHEDHGSAGIWCPALLILAAGGAGWIVLMQNHYATEAAIYLALPVLAAEWTGLFGRTSSVVEPVTVRLRQGWILLLLMAVLFRPMADVGFILAQNGQLLRHDRDPNLAGGYMQDLIVHPRRRNEIWGFCNGSCNDYSRKIGGLEMLREAGAAEPGVGRVLALNFSNPFPALLGRSSPSGTPIWTHIGRSISRQQHPPAEEFFAGVGFVLLARGDPNGERIADIYADTLVSDFRKGAADDNWQLFVRGQ